MGKIFESTVRNFMEFAEAADVHFADDPAALDLLRDIAGFISRERCNQEGVDEILFDHQASHTVLLGMALLLGRASASESDIDLQERFQSMSQVMRLTRHDEAELNHERGHG